MNKRFIVAVLAASVVGLAVGGLLYGVVFAWLFTEGALTLPGVMRDRPAVGWIVLGQLPFSVLLTLIVQWRGKLTWQGGASTGALLGLCMAMGYDFAQYGTSHLWSLTATLVDPFVSAALVGSSGAVVGAVLGGGRDGESRDG